MNAKRVDVGKKETLSLDSAARHILEECRMVLPGIQALFGFQMIVVFNEGFRKYLSVSEQRLHFGSIVLVATAIALVMAPAAVHRQTSQQEVSERFVSVASKLLLASMWPLGLGLCIEVFLVGTMILHAAWLAAMIAFVLFVSFFTLWFLLPRREHRNHQPERKRARQFRVHTTRTA